MTVVILNLQMTGMNGGSEGTVREVFKVIAQYCTVVAGSSKTIKNLNEKRILVKVRHHKVLFKML